MWQNPAHPRPIGHQKRRPDHTQASKRTISTRGVCLLAAPIVSGAMLIGIVVFAARIVGAL